MRICVWKTGHGIADTAAEAVAQGLGAEIAHTSQIERVEAYDVHIGYGILRGTAPVFARAASLGKPWFNLDRGYSNPGHFDGNYRISLNGTQARWHDGIPRKPWGGKLEPWRVYDTTKPILLCPPTMPVQQFFGINPWSPNVGNIHDHNPNFTIRPKGSQNPIDWDAYRAVITFNSSVGWQALQRGIPVISDPEHSIIGSHYQFHGVDLLTQNLHDLTDTRMELFEAMNAAQFTLDEIKRGEAWSIINHYLSMSGLIAENQSPTQSANIPYGNARQPK